MISHKKKLFYYLAAGPFLKLNGILYRIFRAPKEGLVKVHLGPGIKNYLNNWINVDSNKITGKLDVWADLRNPLPFHTNTVDALYSHHVVEHLPNITNHFKEAYRCLKPSGVYRVCVPNGDSAITKFMENNKKWFGDRPEYRSSIGGRFDNFVFCRQEHLMILTHSFLEELLSDAGFSGIKKCLPVKETFYKDKFEDCLQKEWEWDYEAPHTLVLEASKSTI